MVSPLFISEIFDLNYIGLGREKEKEVKRRRGDGKEGKGDRGQEGQMGDRGKGRGKGSSNRDCEEEPKNYWWSALPERLRDS